MQQRPDGGHQRCTVVPGDGLVQHREQHCLGRASKGQIPVAERDRPQRPQDAQGHVAKPRQRRSRIGIGAPVQQALPERLRQVKVPLVSLRRTAVARTSVQMQGHQLGPASQPLCVLAGHAVFKPIAASAGAEPSRPTHTGVATFAPRGSSTG